MITTAETVVTACLAAFGLVWGSYLNVVVHRLPKGLSTAIPASHCPRCSSRIRPVDNVPVLSWLFLGARCRACRGAISVRYPLVEATVALGFVLGFRRFERPVEIFASWLLVCVFLALALIDHDRRLVPVVLTAPLAVAGWAAQPLLRWSTTADAVLTSIVGAALVLAASAAWRRLRGVPGLGAGDAHVVALIGAVFGAVATVRVVLLALAVAALVALVSTFASKVRLPGRRMRPARDLPVAAFLALAALWLLLFDPHGPGSATLLR